MADRMIRKQIYIMSEQAEKLREQSTKCGVSEGQLVRDALNLFLDKPVGDTKIDLDSRDAELQFLRSRKPGGSSGSEGKLWKRDELYDC